VNEIEIGGGIVVDIDGSPARLRLAGVDARPPYPNEEPPPSAVRLTEYLTRLLGNESVYIEYETKAEDVDAWGRSAARIYRAPDGLWVNFEVIRAGYARTSPEKCRFCDVLDYYQDVARTAAKGVWSPEGETPVGGSLTSANETESSRAGDAKPTEGSASGEDAKSGTNGKRKDETDTDTARNGPADKNTEVWITKYGGKYHRATCRFLTDTKQKTTIGEARGKGREACQVCKPPK
jgi:hypothetical protein